MRQLGSILFALPLILALPAAPFAPIQQEVAPDSAFAGVPAQQAAEPILPDPTVPITLDPSIEGSLRNALVKLAASAGVSLFVSPGAEQLLGSGASFLQQGVEVPASEAWSFVESLMVENGLMLCVHRNQVPRLVSVHPVVSSSNALVRPSTYVSDGEGLAELAKHPALLTTMVVTTDNLDVRNLVNSMRGLVSDSRTLTMLSAGDTGSLILAGNGLVVLQTARAIREIDEASGAQRARWDTERQGAEEQAASE